MKSVLIGSHWWRSTRHGLRPTIKPNIYTGHGGGDAREESAFERARRTDEEETATTQTYFYLVTLLVSPLLLVATSGYHRAAACFDTLNLMMMNRRPFLQLSTPHPKSLQHREKSLPKRKETRERFEAVKEGNSHKSTHSNFKVHRGGVETDTTSFYETNIASAGAPSR
jgi:hypothetical protein